VKVDGHVDQVLAFLGTGEAAKKPAAAKKAPVAAKEAPAAAKKTTRKEG
jgi:hypothetical protein